MMFGRRDRRDYENDVFYEVWRSGRNPDAIDYDRVEDSYYQGVEAKYAAAREIRAQDRVRRRLREQREMQEYEYYLSLEDQEHYEQYGE